MAANPLAKYDAAVRALARATSVVEAKDVHDRARALQAIAKVAKSREAERKALELRLRAERRIGEMIAEQRRKSGLAKGAARKGVGRRGKRGSADDPQSEFRLKDMGIDKHLANSARRWAEWPSREFDKLIAALRKEGPLAVHRAETNIFRAMRRAASEREDKVDARQVPILALGQLDDALRADDFADEDVPEQYVPIWTYFEKLLTENPTSPSLPRSMNSAAKIVAQALWQIQVLIDSRGWNSSSQWQAYRIFERMEKRLQRLQAGSKRRN